MVYFIEYSCKIVCFQSEAHLMKGIIPEKHQRTSFDNIIQQALDSIVNEGEVNSLPTAQLVVVLILCKVVYRCILCLQCLYFVYKQFAFLL